MAQTAATVTGTIARVNDGGYAFTLEETPTVWHRLSKFSDPKPAIPSCGTVVEVGFDGAGYVREIRTVQPLTLTEAAAKGAAVNGPALSALRQELQPAGPIDLERAALWAQCLQAAAAVGMNHTVPEIEELADVWFGKALGRGRG